MSLASLSQQLKNTTNHHHNNNDDSNTSSGNYGDATNDEDNGAVPTSYPATAGAVVLDLLVQLRRYPLALS